MSQAITDFMNWFLTNIPTFLLSDPIKYILGFVFLGLVVDLARRIINL